LSEILQFSEVWGTIKPKLPSASGGLCPTAPPDPLLPEILYCLSPPLPQSLAPPLTGRDLANLLSKPFNQQCL